MRTLNPSKVDFEVDLEIDGRFQLPTICNEINSRVPLSTYFRRTIQPTDGEGLSDNPTLLFPHHRPSNLVANTLSPNFNTDNPRPSANHTNNLLCWRRTTKWWSWTSSARLPPARKRTQMATRCPSPSKAEATATATETETATAAGKS